MQQIEITEEQHEYLESLREQIKSEVVGPYGHVRTVDAVQYLIDNHEGDVDVEIAAEGAVAEVDAAGGSDGDASADEGGDGSAPTDDGDDIDEEAAIGELETIDGIGPSRAEALVEAGYDSIEAVDEADPADIAAIDGISESQAEEIKAGINGETSGDADGTASDGGGGGGPMPSASGGGDGGMLSSMQQLLQEHDDKWRDASDTGYEVELPDGTTESAPTKDDVRALLFRHYD